MGIYIKSVDSNHLLSVGVEGFFGSSDPDYFQYNPGTFPPKDIALGFVFNCRYFIQARFHAFMCGCVGDTNRRLGHKHWK